MRNILHRVHCIIFVLAGIVWTGFLMVLVIPIAIVAPLGRIMYTIEHFWAGTILKMAGVRVNVSGLEHIRKDKTYIFISNHQSLFDIPLMLHHTPKQLRMIYKKELGWIPLMGFILWKLKFIAIDRGNHERAVSSLRKAAKRIHDGVNVVIYADGTRSVDGELRPFKKGAFVLAIDAQVDILPVTISGTINVMHKYKMFDVNFDRDVSIVFNSPVSTENISLEQKDALKDRVASEIAASFEKIKYLSRIDDETLLQLIREKQNRGGSRADETVQKHQLADVKN